MRPIVSAALSACLALVASGVSHASPLRHGSTAAAQPGVAQTLSATPSVAGSWHLVAAGLYGYQPSALEEGDGRQRAGGRLALGYAPWEFLQIALSLDASVDSYQWAGDAPDSLVVGALGDPRLSLRTGWALGGGISLGGYFDVWFPSGRGAFNVVGDAISPSVALMASYTPESIPIGIHLNLGYRHDRSLGMLGDLAQLTREQLLLSGATSAQNHFGIRFALEYRIGPVAPFVQMDVDLPLDDGGMDNLPVLLGVGARLWLGPADEVQIHLAGLFRVTPEPAAPDPATGTVWEFPPLVNVMLGATFRLPVAPTERVVGGGGDGGGGGGGGGSGAAAEEPGRVAGSVRCGAVSCGRGARVAISGTGGSPYAPDEETGRYTSGELPPGSYTVEVSAPGHEAASQEVTVEEGQSASLDFELTASPTAERPGVRGRVTDFEGQPVAATVRIPALDVEITCDEEGRFETDADPGEYEIIVSASGFRTQTTRVEVSQAGVVVMNVELRRRR